MKVFIAGLFSVLIVLIGSPVNKQVSHATNGIVPVVVAKPSTSQESVKPQPEKEAEPVGNESNKNVTYTEPQVVAPQETVKPPEPAPQPLADHEQWMQAAGIEPQDWGAVDYIVSHESGWRPTVLNSEGCIGLGQRCPASVLYAACPDLAPVCQLRHFSTYAISRYGSWWGAYNAWVNQHWW